MTFLRSDSSPEARGAGTAVWATHSLPDPESVKGRCVFVRIGGWADVGPAPPMVAAATRRAPERAATRRALKRAALLTEVQRAVSGILGPGRLKALSSVGAVATRLNIVPARLLNLAPALLLGLDKLLHLGEAPYADELWL